MCVCHCTMPLLKGGPEHVDVGFLCQVDLARSFEDSPGLIDALRLQVLSVLNTFQIYAFIYLTIYLCGYARKKNLKIVLWLR